MQRSIVRSTVSVRHTAARKACRVVVRAESSDANKPDNSIFYGGNSYTEAEWAEAQKTGNYKAQPASEPVAADNTPPGIGQLMAFDGPAPELVNGRLAMLGFAAALGAELATGEGVFAQWAEAPAPIFLTFVTFAIASLIPLSANDTPENRAFGPFTASAEKLNGRAAMIGFLAIITIELFKGGSALF